MHNLEKALQSNSSNIISISSHKRLKQQKLMEQMLKEVPEELREAYGDSDVMRIIIAFDHMDQKQAQEFYVKLSDKISTRSKKLMRKCLTEILCWNSSLLPQIEEMAAGILIDGNSKQMASI